MGGAAGGAEALIVDRCAHHQEVAAGETSHPALITYTNLIDSDHMGNLSPPTPGHWRYPSLSLSLSLSNVHVLVKVVLWHVLERHNLQVSVSGYKLVT